MRRLMKKLILVCIVALIAAACSLESDEREDFTLAFIPVENVDMPEYVTPGTTYPVTLHYKRPNTCYYVSQEPYYEINGSTRTVAVQALVVQNGNCQVIENAPTETKVFNFQCPATTSANFTFKFYTGEDTTGNRQFLEVTLPVRQ
jgi:hypothetical protein